MKKLIIIGARGFGREVYNLALKCKEVNRYFEIKGFLDDNKIALDGLAGYPPILNTVEDYIPEKDDVFVCALGDIYFRKKYTEIILEKNGVFISLIHPGATIYSNAIIGNRVVIADNVFISCDTQIGNDVIIHTGTIIGHDVTIGNNCSLGANTFYGGYAKIEDFVTMHPNSSVLPTKIVKSYSVVGISSVVTKNTPANATLYGNPASVIYINDKV